MVLGLVELVEPRSPGLLELVELHSPVILVLEQEELHSSLLLELDGVMEAQDGVLVEEVEEEPRSPR